MPYEQRIDRSRPGCIIFMVDQSGSMKEEFSLRRDVTKAVALCDAINSLLYELALRCIKDPNEGPRHYYDIAVIGYGATVGSALQGPLSGRDLVSIIDIANNPLRVEQRTRITDDAGTKPRRVPVWFDPCAESGTPMSQAIDAAGRLVAPWVNAHPDSFPPIVINISDGAATDAETHGDPRAWAQQLRTLRTRDGNVLFFNVNLSALGGEPAYFPTTPQQFTDDYARMLFDMSSELPAFMVTLAQRQGITAEPGARGFVFNADIRSVVQFLQIGTATYHVAG